MATELMVTDTEQIEQEVAPVVQEANEIAVSSPESYQRAIDFLRSVKAAQKKVTEFFGPMKKSAHDNWKKTVAAENSVLGPLTDAESAVKRKASSYQQEEERKRIAEQRRLQAEADERARKERERLEKQAAKLKTPELKEERLAEAESVAAPVIALAPTVPKTSGVATRTTWKARVVDVAAVPREWMTVNEKALDAFARSTKGSVAVAGVEFYSEQSLAIGGGR